MAAPLLVATNDKTALALLARSPAERRAW